MPLYEVAFGVAPHNPVSDSDPRLIPHPPGLLEYVGRAKDLIVRGGSNISPSEVEVALRSHPDAGVAGFADPVLGERVGALVGLADDASTAPRVDDIIAWLGARLAAYKIPERLRVVDAIPRNTLTKIDRSAVRRELTADRVPPGDPPSPDRHAEACPAR